MKRPLLTILVLSFLSILCAEAQTVIVAREGPLGGGYAINEGGQTLGVSWTQSDSFSNVSIFATLTAGPTAGTAYLTNQIGAGTTAANEIASTSFTFPSSATEIQLFSGLTLTSGTYYLTIVANTSGGGAGWVSSSGPSDVTTAPGVTINSDYVTQSPASYPPASTFFEQDFELLYRVTGVPEPSSIALLLAGGGMVVRMARKRRR